MAHRKSLTKALLKCSGFDSREEVESVENDENQGFIRLQSYDDGAAE